jgi:hypothetical protein
MSHRTIRAPFLVAGTCLALTATLAACGANSHPASGPSPATIAAIRHSITVGFTSKDPVICVQNATPNLIENIYGGSVARCRREQPTSHPASSVAISELSVSGTRAHARAEPHGGESDGQAFRITLAKVGPDWKLDDLRYIYGSDPKTDRQVDLQLKEAGGLQSPFGRGATRCVQTRLRSAFRTGGVPFGNRELTAETKAVLIGCLRSDPSLVSGIRRLFLRQLDRQARKSVGASGAKCIVDHLRRAVRPQDIVGLLAGQQPTSLLRKARAIGAHCGSIQAIIRGFDNFAQT